MKPFFRNVEVLNKECGGSDSSLLASWRHISDQRLSSEISDEMEIHSYLVANSKRGVYMAPLAAASKKRIEMMEKVQKLRHA